MRSNGAGHRTACRKTLLAASLAALTFIGPALEAAASEWPLRRPYPARGLHSGDRWAPPGRVRPPRRIRPPTGVFIPPRRRFEPDFPPDLYERPRWRRPRIVRRWLRPVPRRPDLRWEPQPQDVRIAPRPRERARPAPPARKPGATVRAPRQGPSGVPPAGERRFVPDEVLFTARADVPPQAIDALAREFRLTRIDAETIDLIGATLYRYRIPDRRSVPAVVRALEADRRISVAQPNYLFLLQEDATGAAGSGGGAQQYVVKTLRLPEAHHLSTGDKVLVAVIDSGIDADHPDLEGAVAETFNALESAFEPHDHGTAIAGAIAAHGRLQSVAPRARLLCVRAFAGASQGTGAAQGTGFHVLKGLGWAYRKGARVINLSFAGPRDLLLARALAEARRKGLILIAAAGNSGAKSPPLHPAADVNVIAVTATDSEDRLYAQANRGRHVLLSAPGVDVLSLAPGGAYDVASGTSIAAAHVSGLAALLLERNPTLGQDGVREILTEAARDLGPPGRDADFGVGLPDAYETVRAVELRSAGASDLEP